MRIPQKNPKAKEKLLNAAQELILAKGFVATSVDEICKSAKLTKGSFFHYFKSKKHLGQELLKRYCGSLKQTTQSQCCFENKPADPLQRIYDYIDFAIETSQKPDNKGCLVGVLAQEVSETYPEIRSLCAQGFADWADILTKDLKAAKAKYVPRASFSPKSLAEYLISVLEGSQVLARANNDKKIAKENLQHFKLYLKSLFRK